MERREGEVRAQGVQTDIADAAIERYATEHSSPESGYLHEVAAATRADHDDHHMMVGRLEGAFLAMIVHVVSPALVLEIGTFTGYSALSMAEALPAGGRIITCEVDADHARHARQSLAGSQLGERIELREGPAIDTIAPIRGPIDLVFIDADKESYLDYYEATLPKLSPRGLMVVDNTLWSGRVLDKYDTSTGTVALRRFNDHVARDPRVRCVQLTIRDGVTLIRPAAGRATRHRRGGS